MMGEVVTTDYVKAWQCIGGGRIEAPQTCIGICQDRKVQFVYASEHEECRRRFATRASGQMTSKRWFVDSRVRRRARASRGVTTQLPVPLLKIGLQRWAQIEDGRRC
jgi:hypothetical protein